MIVCIQSPPRLPMMQDQKSLTHHWLTCSGWGRERVSLVFGFKGGRYIRKGHWLTKVNILWLAVEYLNPTRNGKTRNTEPEIGTEESTGTWQNPRVDRSVFGFGPPRCSGPGFWTVLELNHSVLAVRTWTAAKLPSPVVYTNCLRLTSLAYRHISPLAISRVNAFHGDSFFFSLYGNCSR